MNQVEQSAILWRLFSQLSQYCQKRKLQASQSATQTVKPNLNVSSNHQDGSKGLGSDLWVNLVKAPRSNSRGKVKLLPSLLVNCVSKSQMWSLRGTRDPETATSWVNSTLSLPLKERYIPLWMGFGVNRCEMFQYLKWKETHSCSEFQTLSLEIVSSINVYGKFKGRRCLWLNGNHALFQWNPSFHQLRFG